MQHHINLLARARTLANCALCLFSSSLTGIGTVIRFPSGFPENADFDRDVCNPRQRRKGLELTQENYFLVRKSQIAWWTVKYEILMLHEADRARKSSAEKFQSVMQYVNATAKQSSTSLFSGPFWVNPSGRKCVICRHFNFNRCWTEKLIDTGNTEWLNTRGLIHQRLTASNGENTAEIPDAYQTIWWNISTYRLLIRYDFGKSKVGFILFGWQPRCVSYVLAPEPHHCLSWIPQQHPSSWSSCAISEE